MYYGKPDDKDFIFTSNGYKCAVGINYPAGPEEPSEHEIRMVKTKVKGGAEEVYSDWESVHVFWTQDVDRYNDANACMTAFLAEANPKLIAATGGEVPPVPDTFLEQLEHLCRYDLAFNPQTGEVYIK